MIRVILRNVWWATIATALGSMCACSSVPAPVALAALPSVAPVRRAVTTTKTATSEVRAATTETRVAAEDARAAIDAAIVQAHQEAIEKDEQKRAAEQELLARALLRAKELVDLANQKAANADQRAINAEAFAQKAVAETSKFDAAQEEATIRAAKVQEQNDQLRQDQVQMHRWHGLGAVWWGLKTFVLFCFLWLAGFAVIVGALSFFFPAFGVIVGGFFTRIAHVFFPPKKFP